MLGGQIKDPISVLVVFLLLLLLLVEPKLVFIKLLASLPPPLSLSLQSSVCLCVGGDFCCFNISFLLPQYFIVSYFLSIILHAPFTLAFS